MKKNLFYLFALICSMSLFTACSDDDDDANWKKLPNQAITADNLLLETNIPASSDASIKLAMTDAQNGLLSLNKVVRGLDDCISYCQVIFFKFGFTNSLHGTVPNFQT